jgi:hypothetical protein
MPSSTQQKKRKDKECFEEHSLSLHSSPPIISPMSLHAISRLRDGEFKDSNDDKVVTAKEQSRQMGLLNEPGSELDEDESIGGVSVDKEVEREQEYKSTPTMRVEESSTICVFYRKNKSIYWTKLLLQTVFESSQGSRPDIRQSQLCLQLVLEVFQVSL